MGAYGMQRGSVGRWRFLIAAATALPAAHAQAGTVALVHAATACETAATPPAATTTSAEPDDADQTTEDETDTDTDTGADTTGPMAAGALWSTLVSRYRALELYQDTSTFSHTVQRGDEPPQHVEATVHCDLHGEALTLSSSAGQAVRILAGVGGFRTTTTIAALRHALDVWLVPHMVLRCSGEPLADLRPGLTAPLRPREVKRTVDAQGETLSLSLIDEDHDGEAHDDPQAERVEVELTIDAESMLVRRIHARHERADGERREVTVDVEPVYAEPAYEQPSHTAWGASPADMPAAAGAAGEPDNIDDRRDGDGDADADANPNPPDNPPITSPGSAPPTDPAEEPGAPADEPAPAPRV